MQNLVSELSNLLRDREFKLVTAESCTGGLIAAAMTDIAGSSAVFERGFVTYSNEAKQENLGVSSNILRHYGAVSEQCADAMVLGALSVTEVDVAVSVTGIAGPNGGSEEKPVGLVYIATCIRGKEPSVTENHFTGDRTDIRKASCAKAIELLIQAVRAV